MMALADKGLPEQPAEKGAPPSPHWAERGEYTAEDLRRLYTGPELDGPSIYVLMGRILAELGPIGRDQWNEQQKFHFRGYDDCVNALNPLLAKHGVFVVPDVLERVAAQRQTRGGSAMYEVNLHVRFRFYGPLGDFVEASGWGEGTDMGDKATNKATTGALKYVLFQTFLISTQEASDQDATGPEETVHPERSQRAAATPTLRSRVQELVAAGVPDANDLFKDVAEAVYAVRPEKANDLDSAQRADAIRRLGIVVELIRESPSQERGEVLSAFGAAWDGITVPAWAEPAPALEGTVDAEAAALADATISGPSQ